MKKFSVPHVAKWTLSVLGTTLVASGIVYAATIADVRIQTIAPGDTIGAGWYQSVNDRLAAFSGSGSGGGGMPVGYVETAVNLQEDTYGALVGMGWGSISDTCNGATAQYYNCLANEERICADVISPTVYGGGEAGDSPAVGREVVCRRTLVLAKSSNATVIPKQVTGTATITGSNYSGWKTGCSVSVRITGEFSCAFDQSFDLGTKGSDGECRQTAVYHAQNGGCPSFSIITGASWNEVTNAFTINYNGF